MRDFGLVSSSRPSMLVLAFVAASLAGCAESPSAISVPPLTVGTVAGYNLVGMPIAPWGGLPSNAQHEGESLLPALGEELRLMIDGPYCTVDHEAELFCQAFRLTYEMQRDDAWHPLGEELLSSSSGLISSHVAMVQGTRSLNGSGEGEKSERVVWRDSFRRGSIDTFGALAFAGQTIAGPTWSSEPIRLHPLGAATPLAFEVSATHSLSLKPPESTSPRTLRFEFHIDQECPFPARVEALRDDGSLVMRAVRSHCTIGKGPELQLRPGEAAADENPHLRPAIEVLGLGTNEVDFRPGKATFGDILKVLKSSRPDACDESVCRIGWFGYEAATRPNLTLLDQDIGEAEVDRWTLCIRTSSWQGVVVDWNESKHWVEDAECPYRPNEQFEVDRAVLDLSGVEHVLPRFSSSPLRYELYVLPNPSVPDLLAVAGPATSAHGSTAYIAELPLVWSQSTGGYLAQAQWPTRLAYAADPA